MVGDRRPCDSFELVYGHEREFVNHLTRKRIDLALTFLGRGGGKFLERSIVEEGYALAMTDRHPLAGHDEIAPEILGGEVMIVRRHCEILSETSRFFTDRGVRPHFALRSTSDERVLQMVAAGLGITVMPLSYAHPGVSRPRLAGFRPRRTLGWMASDASKDLLVRPVWPMQAIEHLLAPRPTC